MTRPLILSDNFTKRSDEPQESLSHGLAQATASTGAGGAFDRAGDARHVERGLQALRSAQLPLCRRPGPRAQALSICQPTRQLATQRLCTQCRLWPRRRVHQQLAQVARNPGRNLRDQYGAYATPRGSWVDHDGCCIHSVRLSRGGCHSGRHGCGLSRRRRPAAPCGGEAR
jgi:hypothetical protein